MKQLMLLPLCLVLFTFGGEEVEVVAFKVVDVAPASAAKMVKERGAKVIILDIRTPGEFKAGHLKGAVNCDYNNAAFVAELAKLDPDKPVLLHCASGGRSTAALNTLKKAGFKEIYHLKAGFNGWKTGKFPVVK